MTAGEVIVMGVVVAPQGVRGWVRIRPYSDDPAALLQYADWLVRTTAAGAWTEQKLLGGRLHGQLLVAHLAGIASREAAAALRGSDIGVPRASLPAAQPGELYWSDLEGLTVVNRAGVSLGRVAGVTEHGAHPLLRVVPTRGDRAPERLIPYVPAIVDRVDVAAGRIDVDWGEDY